MSKVIELNGKDLTISQIVQIISNKNQKITIATKSKNIIDASFAFVQKSLTKNVIYGVNTGFGPMASHILPKDKLIELQYNLIRSHATGMGKPLDQDVVLAAMIVRLNTLVKGFSGVSIELLKTLEKFINARIIPFVPEHGAVGTSGDLIQLAHIALTLIGEGQVWYEGKIQSTDKVLLKLKIKPHKLFPKEGLSLINGTSVMAGGAALVCNDANKLIQSSILNGAESLEIVNSYSDSFDEVLHQLRPQQGQSQVAQTLRSLLKDSKLIRQRESLTYQDSFNQGVTKIDDRVQEVYSLRCIPQIVGPILDTLQKAEKVVEVELNSTTDNPIVDVKNKRFLHGGNFHGDYIAVAIDQLKASLVKLSMLSERRINFFLNQNINKIYPPFLNLDTPGLTLALQGLQFVATSTTADNQSLAFPHSVHSISTNADNQDVVSMGTDAMLFARQVVENCYIVTAIENVVLTQAVDVLNFSNKLSSSTKQNYKAVRKVFPVVISDKPLFSLLPKVIDLLKHE